MIYTFSNSIFETLNDNDLDSMDKIWSNSKGKHFLFIGNESNFNAIQSSDWFKHLRKSSQDQIEQQYIASTSIGKKNTKFVIESNTSLYFSLSEAVEVLSKPFTVILENREYDANFLHTIINNYKEGQQIKEHYSKGWLIFGNGGGYNIPNEINGMKDRFDKNKTDFPKQSSVYIRAFVIIDSDKKYPSNAEVADDKMALLDFIKQNSPYHVLLKREMENYLPDEIYNEITNNEDFKKAFLALNPSQKDYFDLEKGLPEKNFNQLETEVQGLYNDIGEDSKKVFRKEKLTFYKEDGKKDSFKARFSQLFLSKKITKENLEKRAKSTNQNEFKELLQKINDLL
jgi:hypothetical protein